MSISFLIKRIIRGNRASAKMYLAHLKEIGVTIGNDISIYAPTNTLIDEQYPWMINIGNHVRITDGVKILTHDYSWSVIKCSDKDEMKGAILGNARPVTIGNNVFIGMNAIVLGGTTIGDNTIIGAGSVVSGNIPSDSVVAGVPAKVICSLSEYYLKRYNNQLKEAVELARRYRIKYDKIPPKEVFHEFFMLFSKTENGMEEIFLNKMKLGNNYEKSVSYLKRGNNIFETYEDFIEYCFKE